MQLVFWSNHTSFITLIHYSNPCLKALIEIGEITGLVPDYGVTFSWLRIKFAFRLNAVEKCMRCIAGRIAVVF